MSQYDKRLQEKKRKRLFLQQEWDERNPQVEKAAATFQQYLKGEEPQSVKSSTEQTKKRKKRSKIWFVIPIIILLVGGGSTGYWLLGRDKGDSSKVVASTDSPQEINEQKRAITKETKQYVSQNFSLSLQHPADWKVTDIAGSNVVVIDSPVTQLTNAENKKIDGIIRLQIQNKSYPISGFNEGNATATLDSELLKYANPTPNQRGETHLSFLTYAPGANGINATYITGDYGYVVGQAIPRSDVEAIDPIISLQFLRCGDENCRQPIPDAINLESWKSKDFADPIRSMLMSIQIQ